MALTQGPGYYFEPAWSPDGKSIAFTVDRGERLEIGVVNTEGKGELQLVTDSDINIEPVWSPDGSTLYFVSGRGRGPSIYKIELASGEIAPVVAERGKP